jgi:hypothetical protein
MLKRFTCTVAMLAAFSNVGYSQFRGFGNKSDEASATEDVAIETRRLRQVQEKAAQAQERAVQQQSFLIPGAIVITGLMVAGAVFSQRKSG